MKKTLFVIGAIFLTGGISFAAPTPELLENLTNQILIKQTLEKSGKEVLDQLKPIFTQCASSHKDKAIQSVCKSFLENQFSMLEKKWQNIPIGGVSVFRIGKLTNKERLAYFGLDNLANYSLKRNRIPMDEFEYVIINIPEFSLSLFAPNILLKTALSKEDGFNVKCEDLKKSRKENIDKTKREFPNHRGQIIDEEENLKNTICNSGLRIQRTKKDDIFIDSAISSTAGSLKMIISSKQLSKGKTLESEVKEKCPTWKASASNIYFDKEGNAYYVLDRREARLYGEKFTGLSLAFTGDTSKLIKKHLGVGKNLQRIIENGGAKMLVCGATAYLQTKDKPELYYEISLALPSYFLGNYIGFDLNNPDGSSSFLTK